MPEKDYRKDLKAIIEKNDVKRRDLCEAVGITESALSNVLACRRNLSIDKLLGILGALGYAVQFEREDEI